MSGKFLLIVVLVIAIGGFIASVMNSSLASVINTTIIEVPVEVTRVVVTTVPQVVISDQITNFGHLTYSVIVDVPKSVGEFGEADDSAAAIPGSQPSESDWSFYATLCSNPTNVDYPENVWRPPDDQIVAVNCLDDAKVEFSGQLDNGTYGTVTLLPNEAGFPFKQVNLTIHYLPPGIGSDYTQTFTHQTTSETGLVLVTKKFDLLENRRFWLTSYFPDIEFGYPNALGSNRIYERLTR